MGRLEGVINVLLQHQGPTLLLKQLHKLIFVTQLPPNVERDPNRAYVERYKRELFSGSGWDLKAELKRLMEGSHANVPAAAFRRKSAYFWFESALIGAV